jgi:uncharacterized membrane protein YfcA
MTELIIIEGAEFLCGFFNTVASSGSAVTLPLLVFLGLPPAMANGTNRLPVVIGSVMASTPSSGPASSTAALLSK